MFVSIATCVCNCHSAYSSKTQPRHDQRQIKTLLLKRLYDSVRWRKARALFLRQNPFCILCSRQGRDTPANIVDHIQPHCGDYDLFWDRDNWQALCASCHSSLKRQQELGGRYSGCDVDGLPLDPGHEWA